MAFAVTANPTEITLASGENVNVIFTFTDVPAETTEQILEEFVLGGVTVTVNVLGTLDEPDPQLGTPSTPVGIIRQVVSIDRATAVINYSRP